MALVLFDGWESLGRDPRMRLEDALMHVAYSMPNTLFIVSGRERLQWGESRASRDRLRMADPLIWPNLQPTVTAEPRQHLLGRLSDADCDAFLREALTDGMPSAIRTAIVRGAGGLPLYLDLSLTRYMQVQARREPKPSDFGQPFREIVQRVLEDLDPVERDLLRAASMLPYFDVDLLVDMVGGATTQRTEDFLRQPFVEERHVWPAYSLHSALRAAIRHADTTEDRWGDLELSRHARALSERIEGLSGGRRTDRAACFRLGIALIDQAGTMPPWLSDLGQQLAAEARWSAFFELDTMREAPLSTAAVAGFAAGVARMQAGAGASIPLYRRALSVPELPSHAREPFTLGLVSALQDMGDFREAQRLLRPLADQRPQGEASRVEAWLDIAAGRFRDGTRTLEAYLEEADVLRRGSTLSMIAAAETFSGLWESAARRHRTAFTLGETIADEGGRARMLSHMTGVLAWSSPQEALALIEQALALEERAFQVRHVPTLLAQKVIAGVGSLSRPELESALGRAAELASALSAGWATTTVEFARAFVAFAHEDTPQLERVAVELERSTEAMGAYQFLPSITRMWSGDRADGSFQWLQRADEVERVWRTTAEARRAQAA